MYSQDTYSLGSTLQDVRLELAREEASNVALGREPRHKISMATFMMTGFDLEDSQYVLFTRPNVSRMLITVV